MKIEVETIASCAPEKIWAVLADWPMYSDWNPWLKPSSTVPPEIDSPVALQLLQGGNWKKYSAVLSGLAPNKYMSWTITSGVGKWWSEIEIVIRMQPLTKSATTETKIFVEVFTYGLHLRFGRDSFKSQFKKGMDRMLNSLAKAII